MAELIGALLNPYVLVYLLVVYTGNKLSNLYHESKQRRTAAKRRAQGLPEKVMLDHARSLEDWRNETRMQNWVLFGSVVVTPFLLAAIAHWLGEAPTGAEAANQATTQQTGLALTFVGLMAWVAVSATDLSKAFLGGLAFRTLAIYKKPFQLGDRVTLKGISGKVVDFDTYFVTLDTPNDDRISIPTYGLWGEVLTSANAGARASLCVMEFYLSPGAGVDKIQRAEDAVWDAVQASPYYDPAYPMQIYINQTAHAIRLTAKAYVALTFNEPLFVSDVTHAFLADAKENRIPLARNVWDTDTVG